jgi:hypothetical protein
LRQRVEPMVARGLMVIACLYAFFGILLMAKMVSLYI